MNIFGTTVIEGNVKKECKEEFWGNGKWKKNLKKFKNCKKRIVKYVKNNFKICKKII